MKLYNGGIAPNPRRVSIFLAEKGIEIETQQFDIAKLEHKSEQLAKLNSRQRLPVLELDDGTVIAESVAICRYLEEIHPEPPLMGVDSVDKALVEMWQRRVELEFFMPIAMAFRHLHPVARALQPVQITSWGEHSQLMAREAMERMNFELSSQRFIAGERFTIADITAITAYQFLKPARIPAPNDLPNLQRWFEEVMERPSTKW